VVFRGCSGVFRGVPRVFRGVPGCSGSVPGFTDTRVARHSLLRTRAVARLFSKRRTATVEVEVNAITL